MIEAIFGASQGPARSERAPIADFKSHRSHFGSRYKLGCCGHAGLFRNRFDSRLHMTTYAGNHAEPQTVKRRLLLKNYIRGGFGNGLLLRINFQLSDIPAHPAILLLKNGARKSAGARPAGRAGPRLLSGMHRHHPGNIPCVSLPQHNHDS